MSEMVIFRGLADHSIDKGKACRPMGQFSVVTIEVFQTRYVPKERSLLFGLGRSQVPDKGVVEFQLSQIVVGKINWCSGESQEQFVHNIEAGLVICNQRNHCEQRLNFFAEPREILLFLSQDAMKIFHAPPPIREHG
jgi:hypothetical protein